MERGINNERAALRKRGLYMVLALVAAIVLLFEPVFSFQQDKGIKYVRSFTMKQKVVLVTQTELENGVSEVVETMSIRGLHYCAWALILACVSCLVCSIDDRRCMQLCLIGISLAGLYYLLMIYYAIQIVDDFYATLYPNFFALLPAVIIELLILVRRSIAHNLIIENTDEEEEEITNQTPE